MITMSLPLAYFESSTVRFSIASICFFFLIIWSNSLFATLRTPCSVVWTLKCFNQSSIRSFDFVSSRPFSLSIVLASVVVG